MAFKVSGKIEKIFEIEQKSASFQTREFVIEVADGQYPQMVKFQLVQDKVSLTEHFSEGDAVEVDFDLRGREWNGKYFTNLQAWKLTKSGDVAGEADRGLQKFPASSSASNHQMLDPDDDIPF